MKTTIRVCGKNGWEDTTLHRLRKADRAETISITREKGVGTTTEYTVFRPAKSRDMTPVAYYRKYQCVPARYADRVNGRYYCNPAHCSKSWTDKEARDKHLSMAYGMLG